MCCECMRFPCHPRCPNADEEKPVCSCSMCGDGIYAEETMYVIDGVEFCESCIDNCRTYAKFDDY